LEVVSGKKVYAHVLLWVKSKNVSTFQTNWENEEKS